MLIFVYEFVTGGGTFCDDSFGPPADSLLAQGAAMCAALAADFDRIEGVEVLTLRDARVSSPCQGIGRERIVGNTAEEDGGFCELAAAADYTVVIAPEINGHLLDRCQRVEACGGRLLSPGPEFVALTSDKYLCNRYLHQHNVPVPNCALVEEDGSLPVGWDFPVVRKPRWGAGSEGVSLVEGEGTGSGVFFNSQNGIELRRRDEIEKDSRPLVVEQFIPGTAASVAVLCGPNQQVALPPCIQTLTADGRFRYLGGRFPLDAQSATRAVRLARKAVDALPNTVGYIGLDIVLGKSDDVVIEVNPRLTTSYTALRVACTTNLAAALLQLADGQHIELSFYDGPLRFTCDEVRRDPQPVPATKCGFPTRGSHTRDR